MLEDRDVAILVADVDLAVHDQRRAPRSGKHVVDPMALAGLGIEAVEQAAVVGDVEDVVLDRHAAQRAVHDFVEVDLAVAVFIDRAVVPNRGRVRIRPGEVALLGLDRLQPLVRQLAYPGPPS